MKFQIQMQAKKKKLGGAPGGAGDYDECGMK